MQRGTHPIAGSPMRGGKSRPWGLELGRRGRHAVAALLLSGLLVFAWLPSAMAVFAGDSTARVSIDTLGGPPNLDSYHPSLSADGRYVAFHSEASDLVPGDTNGLMDVFVRDRLTGTTKLVSADAFGGPSFGGNSFDPSISADGRFVAFESAATDLIQGDQNAFTDVFVRDVVTGVTTRVSVQAAGIAPDGNSYNPSISGDGNLVAFESDATNLVAGDVSGHRDVFVRNRNANTTWSVRGFPAGAQPNADSGGPAISANGNFIVFHSAATNLISNDTNALEDIFVAPYLGAPGRLSVGPGGVESDGGSWAPSISADGLFVAFHSSAGNLVAGDVAGNPDVFVRDRLANMNSKVSVSMSGSNADGGSMNPSISADGRFVAFETEATNMVAGGGNGEMDILRRDRTTGITQRVNVSTAGAESTGGESMEPFISADGMHVAFRSGATDLIAGDGNAFEDVFVRTYYVPITVYRFYNRRNGSHFYTPNEAEKANVIANLSKTYTYEGIAYTFNGSLSFQPLHRFYNKKNGSHFYTPNEAEKANVIANLSRTYTYEGPTYDVATLPGAGSAVHRFYNKKNGSHFYTASETEKANVTARLSGVYMYEGPTFYLPN